MGISFSAVDVLNDPEARAALLKLGVQSVPVLAKGQQYIFCQNLEDVAEFVGLQGSGHTPLAPEILVAKWLNVLRAAERYIRQIPDFRLHERAIDNRDRSLRLLSHHIFRIGEAFLETAIDDVEYRTANANVPPQDGTCNTGEEIVAYGAAVIERIENWWARLDDKSCRQKIRTFYGAPPMHQLLERSAWHSAQHVRQIMAVLERFGLEPSGRLSADDLAGLPLPEGVWD